MKQIHIITHYIGGTGGVQFYNETLAEVLASFGYKVNVIGLAKQEQDGPERLALNLNNNIQFYTLNEEDIFFRKPHLFFSNYISHKVSKQLEKLVNIGDTIIVSNPICMPFVKQSQLAKKCKIIAQFHGSVKLAMQGRGMYMIYRFLIKRYYEQVDHFLVLTSDDAKILKQKYKFKNVDYVLNPCRFACSEVMTNVRFSNRIIFLGRLDKIKQIDHIIQAFYDSNLSSEGITLDIFGDGPEKDKLLQKIEALNAKNIYLHGRTSEALKELAKSAFIVMSSESEGLPLNLIEAITIGLPVLSYDTSAGIHEIVIDNYNGKIVEKNNVNELSKAMIMLIKDKENLEVFSRNAKKHSEKFSQKQFATNIKKYI
ncbi:MAG: glycosyltransferase [Culicoidibacterales bacterium]